MTVIKKILPLPFKGTMTLFLFEVKFCRPIVRPDFSDFFNSWSLRTMSCFFVFLFFFIHSLLIKGREYPLFVCPFSLTRQPSCQTGFYFADFKAICGINVILSIMLTLPPFLPYPALPHTHTHTISHSTLGL